MESLTNVEAPQTYDPKVLAAAAEKLHKMTTEAVIESHKSLGKPVPKGIAEISEAMSALMATSAAGGVSLSTFLIVVQSYVATVDYLTRVGKEKRGN